MTTQRIAVSFLLSFFFSFTFAAPSPYQRLMVIGGYPNTSHFEVETIDLSGNNQHCKILDDGLNDYYGVGTFFDGEAMVCNSNNARGGCFIYDNITDAWSIGPNSTLNVYRSASVMVNNDKNWWIAGGYPTSSDTVLYNGKSFSPYENLPYEEQIHHLVAVNQTHVIYLEGVNPGIARSFDLTTSTWNPFTPLPSDKDYYYAGLVKYLDGSRHLVASGGSPLLGKADAGDISTWIYDLDSGIDIWRPGPALPLQRGTSVPFGDTFLAVGGRLNYSPFSYTDQIWEFNADPSEEKWEPRNERLKSAKYGVAAFLVPNNYATC